MTILLIESTQMDALINENTQLRTTIQTVIDLLTAALAASPVPPPTPTPQVLKLPAAFQISE